MYRVRHSLTEIKTTLYT